MERILILTPFRNEDHSIPQYLAAIKKLRYPPELIDLYWLENDSTDRTLEMLEEARSQMPFRSVTLESVTIMGPVDKRPPKEYVKDTPYGPDRMKSWMVIWNDYFLPFVRQSEAEYMMPWYADVVAPRNVITEYLKVFETKPDAGWVGGAIHRRYPQHREIGTPWPEHLTYSKEVVEVAMAGHCWVIPRKLLVNTTLSPDKTFHPEIKHEHPDIHLSLVWHLYEKGFKVYYQPSIYLKHVSSDGKIYSHNLGG